MNEIENLHDYAVALSKRNHNETMVMTIEKELLHYEILDSLDRAGLLEQLVFQGGTSLRLCYGAERYSEDLDFSGGQDFDASRFTEIKECVEQAVTDRYSVETLVKPPKRSGGLVSTWTVVVDTTPTRSDIARQRIKIEIASIDAHDVTVRPLTVNYENLADSYADVMVPVESREEILADKIESFVCSDHLRFRDLWDLAWLGKRSDLDLAKAKELRLLKAQDYKEIEKYPERFSMVQAKLDDAFNSEGFAKEMLRFLPKERVERTIDRPLWLEGTHNQLIELFSVFADIGH
ncbi:nucleotidyl transferase AbiEii/AbiGii toxin family protein [Bifidobacterium sp. SO1]|uniref:nucleotidyl transferase AbiEii/AbiGii toxin family protein n=1 Tax=Bifidobacterium sp. SO1 TaxID=2809029 RepID=UPI001BDC9AB3|nr:nucleotidyl transferase AbiEii/AbiGii toxin family protein [Bifidobacterium sp. SO1]MBT1162189.1 nucleotidyl transferase AbiEii/AbiGii toxin family protein [Bifidobacterium sp. SO1]